MSKKKSGTRIPLRSLFKDESFRRNYKMLADERETRDDKLFEALTDELIDSAASDIERADRQKTASAKGGKQTADTIRRQKASRNQKIYEAAKQSYRQGKDRGTVVDHLSKRFRLTPRQIRNILNNMEMQ